MNTLRSPLASRSFKRDRRSWMITLFIMMFAGGYGFYWHNNPEVKLPPVVEKSNSNPRIMVLAFDRIVQKENGKHISRDKLRSHLQALTASGFQPVTVQSLYDFYYNDAKLPDKPVLLMFDYGYLDTYVAAHPVLVQTGWRAAISITTSKQISQDTHYLYWDRLQRMLNSGYWEVLSHGNSADDMVTVDALGNTAPFLTALKWLPEFNRYETPAEFLLRLTGDIQQSLVIIRNKLDVDAQAYVFRYGSPEYIYKDPELLQAELQMRSKSAPLAFINDNFGVNDHGSDPHDLRRLPVPSNWSSFDLIDHLNTALTFPDVGQTPGLEARHWVNSEGTALIQGNRMELAGTPRSLTWLSGSQWQDNWVMTADIRVSEGDFWLVQDNKHRMEWRFGGNSEGLYLKLVNGDDTTNMLRKIDKKVEHGWHKLKVVRRGNGIWISWDNEPLWDKSIYLPETIRGPIGWLTWSDTGNSRFQVKNTQITALPYQVHMVSARPTTGEVQELTALPETVAALSPYQFTLTQDDLIEHNIDSNLFKLLRNRFAWQLTPTVIFSPNAEVNTQLTNGLETLLARATLENWGGIHLDMSTLPGKQQRKIEMSVRELNQKLLREHRNLLITQTAGQPPHAMHSNSMIFAAAQNQ